MHAMVCSNAGVRCGVWWTASAPHNLYAASTCHDDFCSTLTHMQQSLSPAGSNLRGSLSADWRGNEAYDCRETEQGQLQQPLESHRHC